MRASDIQGQRNSNNYPTEQVPHGNRHSWLRLTLVWSGFILCMTNFLTGSSVSYGMKFIPSVLALAIGNLILMVIAIVQGLLAYQSGCSFSYLTRYTFGKKGAKLIALFIAFSFICWASVGVGLAAETLSSVMPYSSRMIALIFTVLFSISALYGFDGLTKVSAIGIPVILLISFFGLYQILRSKGYEVAFLLQIPPYSRIAFGEGVSITVGSWIVGAIASPDILRYAKGKKDVFISMGIAFFFLNTLQMAIGAAMGLVAGTWNLPIILSKLGFGALGIVLLLFVSWTTLDNDVYAAGLGLSTFLQQKRRFWPTLICILVSGVLSVFGFYRYFSSYLYYLSIIFAPIGGVMIIDTFLVFLKIGRGFEEKEDVCWSAYGALVLGIGAAVAMPGPVPFLISMGVAMGIYLLLKLILMRSDT